MSEEAKQIGCVLRIFGAPQMAVQQAVAGFPAGWHLCRVRCMSRGGETLVALTAEDKAGLTRAEQSLRTCFPGDLYAQGDTDLAACTVRTLEQHKQLLVCADAAAGALVDPRLEAIAAAEKIFDFGSESYTHPQRGPRIQELAQRIAAKTEGGPVQEAAARLRAACRVAEADLAAACVEKEGGALLLVGGRKNGYWLRAVWESENPGLWLLDMIRRAAAGLPQAQGTRWVKYGADLPEELSDLPQRPAEAPEQGEKTPAPAASEETPAEGDKPSEPSKEAPNPEAWVPERNEPLPRPDPAPAAAEPPKKGSGRKWLGRLLVLLLLVVLAALGAAWYYTGGDLTALPEVLGIKEFSLSGASLMEIFFIR